MEVTTSELKLELQQTFITGRTAFVFRFTAVVIIIIVPDIANIRYIALVIGITTFVL